MKTKFSRKNGFTLIELIVSLTIFTVFIGILGNSYVFISRAERDALETRKVYAEARSLMDQMVEEARLMAIDYDCYSADYTYDDGSFLSECDSLSLNENQTSILALVSSEGTKRALFRFDEENQTIEFLKLEGEDRNWTLSEGFEGGFQSLKSENVEITDLDFLINPLSDPRENLSNSNFQYQPKATILLTVSGESRAREKIEFRLQTTVSSRVY